MYCPEDGTHIPIGGGIGVRGVQTIYPPCCVCHTRWVYDGENGRYEVYHYPEDMAADPALAFNTEVDPESTLKALGTSHRAMGVDALVANIVEAMEKKALAEGQCTYYTGTFAVARETLATAGLTCEHRPDSIGLPDSLSLRWVAFFGDDWEYLTRAEAIKHLLAERS